MERAVYVHMYILMYTGGAREEGSYIYTQPAFTILNITLYVPSESH